MTRDYDVWVTYRIHIPDCQDEDEAKAWALEEVGSRVTPDDVEVEEVHKR